MEKKVDRPASIDDCGEGKRARITMGDEVEHEDEYEDEVENDNGGRREEGEMKVAAAVSFICFW